MPDRSAPAAATEGVHRGPDQPSETLPVSRVRTAAGGLAELLGDVGWYHPGLLYSVVPLTADPFTTFAAERNLSGVVPSRVSFERPVVSGLSGPHASFWSRSLDSLPLPVFQEYITWLGSAVYVDRTTGRLFRVRYKTIPIPDPLYLECASVILAGTVPQVPVVCVSIDSNVGCWYYRGVGVWPMLESVWTPHVFDDTAKFAKGVFTEETNPLPDLGAELPGLGVSDDDVC